MRSQTPKVGFGDSYSFGQISDMWGQPSIFVHRLISRDLVATDEGGLVTLTGELLRDLILKPTHRLPADPNTQTTHPKMTNSRTQIAGPAVAYVLRHHIGSGGRILNLRNASGCLPVVSDDFSMTCRIRGDDEASPRAGAGVHGTPHGVYARGRAGTCPRQLHVRRISPGMTSPGHA